MKFKLLFVVLLIISSCATSKRNKDIEGIYEIACGKCIYDMTGDDCDLAVLIDGKHYYVDGSGVSDHGDEHADDGLCETPRKALIKGQIKYGVFLAESVKIITEE
mgnify:CR=1 FL=1|jgi:hypothetical protein|tara:strand:- start:16322 stop:16636 length:315 start_codon:yes stop_codon:yes gene_type:complete